MPVGLVLDREILDLYYRAADIYLDSYPCTSLTAVLDAARRGLPVQRLANPYQNLLWRGDIALDSMAQWPSNQVDYVAQVLEWLDWPEARRTALGGTFRAAVLREHCGSSWKTIWLDPAVNALREPGDAPIEESKPPSDDAEGTFVGLAGLSWGAHWPAGMFAASAILSTERLPPRIRLSGLLHSIKPLLFDTAGDGMFRKRFQMFRWLLGTIVPRRISTFKRAIQWPFGDVAK